jgi:altronate dehydratase small subunit
MAAPNPKPSQVLVIDDTDNVATTLAALAAGRELLVDRCGRAHRVLLKDEIPTVRKYGVVIARAMAPIEAGQHVHVHNVESNRGRGDRA